MNPSIWSNWCFNVTWFDLLFNKGEFSLVLIDIFCTILTKTGSKEMKNIINKGKQSQIISKLILY